MNGFKSWDEVVSQLFEVKFFEFGCSHYDTTVGLTVLQYKFVIGPQGLHLEKVEQNLIENDLDQNYGRKEYCEVSKRKDHFCNSFCRFYSMYLHEVMHQISQYCIKKEP